MNADENGFNRQPQRQVNKSELMAQARGEATSQATVIEQSRAVAQVQGALVVAQNRPRDTIAAANRMREACQNHRLAERAFFAFPRGGTSVSGKSIHLATELARCWGNLEYGITELRRDDLKHESEMQAYSWDLETNLRATISFIVPHKRDKKGGAELLTDMRDIYENNANSGARRLRECIFRALPRSFTEEAEELCRSTLEHGGGESIEVRRERLIDAFADIGINPRRLAKRVGKAVDKFTSFDLGELRIAYRSIRNGDANAGELFPDDSGSEAAAELAKAVKPEAKETPVRKPPEPRRPVAKSPTEEVDSALTDKPATSGGAMDDPLHLSKAKGAEAKRDLLVMALQQADKLECDRIWSIYRERMRQLDNVLGVGEWQRIDDYVVNRIDEATPSPIAAG